MKGSCLSDETLSNYVEGRLNDNWNRRVEGHLPQCDACLEAMTVARIIADRGHLIKTAVTPTSVTRRAILAIRGVNRGRWADNISSFLRAWTIGWPTQWRLMRARTLFSVRGHKNMLSDDLFSVRRSYRDLKVEIGIEKTSQNTAHVRIHIIKVSHPRESTRVSLYRNYHEREIASFLLEDAPVFIENIPFGHYSLVFSRNGSEIGHYHFFLKESFHERE